MYYSFLIHSFNDGHLGCFQYLVIYSAGMNTGMHKSFSIGDLGFLGYIPGSGITGSTGSFIFSFFEEIPYCFPQWLHQSAFPPTVH